MVVQLKTYGLEARFWDTVSIVRCVDYLRIADNSELFIGASRRKGKNQ